MLQLHLRDRQFYCLLRYDLYQRFYGSSHFIVSALDNDKQQLKSPWKVHEGGKCQYTGIMMDHFCFHPWWQHGMEMLQALLVICEWNTWETGGPPHKGSAILSFDILFDAWIFHSPNSHVAGDLGNHNADLMPLKWMDFISCWFIICHCRLIQYKDAILPVEAISLWE